MTVELKCTGCGQQLRVSDEHAGKQARCPSCKTVMTVPASGSASASASAIAPSAELWHVRLEDGQLYGPVPKSELDSWVAQGRITATTQLRRDEQPNWLPASRVYASLGSSSPSALTPGANPFSETPAQPNPYATPNAAQPGYGAGPYGATGGYRIPHRGGVILTLGILAIVCNICLVPGICAWSMGATDLNAMRVGRMDRSGYGMTQAGMVLGIVGTILYAVLSAFNVMAGGVR